jgi:hypothetical protein
MAKGIFEGVLISDGDLPGEEKGQLIVSISRQNALPSDIKNKIAEAAKAAGANGVKNFEIAQAGHSWFANANLLKWDSESLYGIGVGVRIAKEQMGEALR